MGPRSPSPRSRAPTPCRGRSSAFTHGCFVLGVLLTIALPAQATNPIVSDGPTTVTVHADLGTSVPIEASFAFRLLDNQSVYLKVLPTEDNPAYRNGEPGASGWWTEVTVLTEGGEGPTVATAGRGNVELGVLPRDVTHTVRLHLHVPAGVWEQAGSYRADYSLASRSPEGGGSGAVRDPSVGLRIELDVGGSITTTSGTHESSTLLPKLAAAAAAVAGIGVLLVALRRNGRGPRTSADKERDQRG